ncbi:30S ribosomal protein S9 [Salibacteraceae bacterium]|jgi:small subunit ribosomal protein S9|nr:30S ribosomal protein S9 [Salibacteraceae bacterium]HAQ71708.1 30S ribosomal protein S9 [Flavobacteriales bacterium]MDA9267478.1 30S ribosomal protein S9 [Salibacteraceae bacterium]MDB4105739.1 30S ribosomal protein S9 [Salibacteraceae bacterium]MDB9708344.1 30S ribosomal protein S9 [Salibacteraceae bacterium]
MDVINALGRRKASIARVYLQKGKGNITINHRDYKEYVDTAFMHHKLHQPFATTETEGQYDVTVNVTGGGINGQVEAIRLGISRALVKINAEYKSALRAEGFMTRDPRMVERKKPGQKKARKRFQFSKR